MKPLLLLAILCSPARAGTIDNLDPVAKENPRGVIEIRSCIDEKYLNVINISEWLINRRPILVPDRFIYTEYDENGGWIRTLEAINCREGFAS